MAHPPDDAVSHQTGQHSVDGRAGLAQDERQLRRIDEGRPAECVKQLSFGKGQVKILFLAVSRWPSIHGERQERQGNALPDIVLTQTTEESGVPKG